MTDAQIHWLSGSTHLDVDDVLQHVHEAAKGCSFEVMDPVGVYTRRYRGPEGLLVMAEPKDGTPESTPPVAVHVPGAACEWLGAEGIQSIASILKPTRVDFAWDGAPFSVADVHGWVRDRQMRTRLRSADSHGRIYGEGGGNTVVLGSRHGTAQVCVYDRRGPVRLELRLFGDRAAAAYEVLMSSPSSWSPTFLEVLRGVVDFVDRSDASRADRAPLLDLWQRFVGAAERVVVDLAGRAAPSLDRAISWVRNQVAPTLALLVDAGVAVGDVIAEGRSRHRQRHRVRSHAWRVAGASPSPA